MDNRKIKNQVSPEQKETSDLSVILHERWRKDADLCVLNILKQLNNPFLPTDVWIISLCITLFIKPEIFSANKVSVWTYSQVNEVTVASFGLEKTGTNM